MLLKSLAAKIESWDQKEFFNHPCLDENSEKCNSNEYFKEVSQIINLQDLYTVVATCHNNDQVEYYPVLLEIKTQFIRDAYDGASHLLQVWNTKAKKILDLPLPSAVRLWNLSFDHLVYSLEGENDAQVIRLSDLQVAKVLGFAGSDVRHLAVNGALIYAATDKSVNVLSVPEDAFGSEISSESARRISVDQKIHGFFINKDAKDGAYVITAFENVSNQLDFNKLIVSNLDDDSEFTYSFVQLKMIHPRKMDYDAIQKIRVIFNNDRQYAVALRKSGSFDIYIDFSRTELKGAGQAEDTSSTYLIDVELSIHSFYFKTTANEILELEHKNSPAISFQNSYPVQDSYFDWNKIHLKIIQNYVKLYSGIYIDGSDYNAVVCHGKIVSFYDLLKFQWKSHKLLEAEVLYLFYIRWTNVFINLLLENGQVLYADFNKMTDGLPEIGESCKIEGELVHYHYDNYALYPLYVVVKEDDEFLLKIITKNAKVSDVADVKINAENGKVSVTCFRFNGKSYILLQDDSLKVYERTNDNEDEEVDFKLLHDLGKSDKVTGIVHSAITSNIKKNIFFFDKENAYLIKISPSKFTKFENINCIRCVNDGFTGNFAICQTTQSSKNPGFRYVDLAYNIEKDQCSMLPLVDVEIGALDQIEWGLSWTRWGFIRSLSDFIITHYPDRCFNRFFNDQGQSAMVFYKQVKDRLISYMTSNKIYTWDVVTGKLKFINDISGFEDISEFERFNPRGMDTTIFKSLNPVTDSNLRYEDFYEAQYLSGDFLGQKSYRTSQKEDAALHLFREYELINERTVRINLEFVYPHQKDLYLNINSNKDRVIVKDGGSIVHLYQTVPIAGKKKYQVKLEHLKVIKSFPFIFHIYYQYRLDFFSPDFSKFINADISTNQLFIQDTLTGKVEQNLPQDLAVIKEDQNPFMVICRITWEDNKTLRIANEDGYEKLVDVENNFKLISHGQIPLFNELQGKEWVDMYHIYKSRPATSEDDIKLKRLYQNYKSEYAIRNGKLVKNDFHQFMFQQDYEHFTSYNHSFSLLQWQIVEQLRDGYLKVSDLSERIIQNLIYAVFPGGNTVLHLICTKQDQLEQLLKVCHPEGKIKHHLPFLVNFQGKTPIHLCKESGALKSIDLLLAALTLYPVDHHSRLIEDCHAFFIEKDLPMYADYINSRFKQTPQLLEFNSGNLPKDCDGFFTSTPWLNEIEFREKELEPADVERKMKLEVLDLAIYHYSDQHFDNFFEKLAQSENLKYFESRTFQTLIDFNYGLVQKYLMWKMFYPFCVFQVAFFLWVNYTYENRQDPDIEPYYWVLLVINGLFALYFFSNEARQIISERLDYFKSPWNYIDIIPPMGIAFIIVLSVIEILETPEQRAEHELKEINAMINGGMTPDEAITEMAAIIVAEQAFERQILAITTLFMWFKFLYFFRIFEPTAYLIRMIVTVIASMQYFFLVLAVTIIGFGNAFLVIALGNTPTDGDDNPRFIDNFFNSMLFSYRMVLGDFDTTQFGEVGLPLLYFFFMTFTIFNMIVMLNLLIAIISDAYASVVQNATQAGFQEKATMIAENSRLIPESAKASYAQNHEFILVAIDLETEDKPRGQEAVISGIQAVENNLKDILLDVNTRVSNSEARVDKSIEDLKFFITRNVPQQVIQTKIHKNKLTRMTFFTLVKLDIDYEEAQCDGANFDGCKSQKEGESETRTDDAETLYHCGKCNFDVCKSCNNEYEDLHVHDLTEMTFADLKAANPAYANGWGCDCRHFQGCHTDSDGFKTSDENAVIFHNNESYFDLCEKCAEAYTV